ncbi:MAG TPA: hypothetical protein G4O06_03615 [Dehalococcoidia bacterium]|nr:hypothetical protein [Dehalococcoidia bacterium]
MVNALSIVTKEADDKNGGKTEYYDRFKAFLKEFQIRVKNKKLKSKKEAKNGT